MDRGRKFFGRTILKIKFDNGVPCILCNYIVQCQVIDPPSKVSTYQLLFVKSYMNTLSRLKKDNA